MSERLHIISATEAKELARPISGHVDTNEIDAYIAEVETRHIIPAVGYETYRALLDEEHAEDIAELYAEGFNPAILLSGGEWSATDCACAENGVQYIDGLKKTAAYFVYAKMARADGSIVARSGFMRHEDQYAYHVDDAKLKQYNDIMDMAEKYLSDCLLYAKAYRKDCKRMKVHGTRAYIHAIGD